ncbi:MAG: flagellar motor protein MotB [Sphingobacteriales bacterium]|nr:MAG: flagellar motor protein MotB [Sphingobacteriales bacterium]
MRMPLLLGGAALILSGLSSCVAKRKYVDAQNRIGMLQRDSMRLVREGEDLQSRVNLLDAANQSTANRLNQTQEEVLNQQQRLQQLQGLIDRQRQATEGLRAKIAEALNSFTSDQLTVSMKNGKVYVSLAESLLFPSGSAEVNAKGKEALGTLAAALNQNPDINVLVEGHTDSIPITKRFPDNWALSVARSTEIVRILTADYSVAPTRVTASGRSSYEPLAPNSTPEGRALNRRTEIILAPRLDELMRLIEGAPAGQ